MRPSKLLSVAGFNAEESDEGDISASRIHSVRSLAHVLWLKRWLVISIWALLALPVGVFLAMVNLPHSYSATTVIRFPQVVGAQNNVMHDVAISEGESIVSVFNSFQVMEATVNKLFLRFQVETPDLFRHDVLKDLRYSDTLARGTYEIALKGSEAAVSLRPIEGNETEVFRGPLQNGTRLEIPGLSFEFTREFLAREGGRKIQFRFGSSEQAVAALKKNLSVKPLGRSNCKVSLSYRDPYLVAEVLNALRDQFLSVYYGTTEVQDAGVLVQMERDMGEAKQHLEQSQNVLSRYYAEHPSLSQQEREPRAEDNLNYLESRQELETARNRKAKVETAYQAKPSKERKEERFFWALDLMAAMAEAGEPRANILRGRLTELNNQLVSLKATLGPEHPRLLDTYSKMDEIYAEIDETERGLVRGLEEKQTGLNAKVSQFKPTSAPGVPVKARLELDRLNQVNQNNQQIYDHLLEGYNRAKMVTGSEFFKVAVVDEARPAPYEPPSLKTRLAFAAASVAILALLVPFLFGAGHLLFQKIWTPEDIKRLLKVKHLGSFPQALNQEKAADDKAPSVDPKLLFYGKAFTLGDLEAFRQIREEVESYYANPSRPGKLTLLVTSTLPEEGKTLISSNLALTFARKGKRTLLIDADFRLGRIAQAFNISSATGVDEILGQENLRPDEFLRAAAMCYVGSMQKNLVLLPRKNFNPDAGELVSSEKFKSLLRMVRDQFDVVILDTPPMTITSEPLALCEMVDGAIFVCRSGITSLANATEAVGLLRERKVKVGAILNGLMHTPFENNRYRKYSYYYQNGGRPRPLKPASVSSPEKKA